jgi:hypothetical protein
VEVKLEIGKFEENIYVIFSTEERKSKSGVSSARELEL